MNLLFAVLPYTLGTLVFYMIVCACYRTHCDIYMTVRLIYSIWHGLYCASRSSGIYIIYLITIYSCMCIVAPLQGWCLWIHVFSLRQFWFHWWTCHWHCLQGCWCSVLGLLMITLFSWLGRAPVVQCLDWPHQWVAYDPVYPVPRILLLLRVCLRLKLLQFISLIFCQVVRYADIMVWHAPQILEAAHEGIF